MSWASESSISFMISSMAVTSKPTSCCTLSNAYKWSTLSFLKNDVTLQGWTLEDAKDTVRSGRIVNSFPSSPDFATEKVPKVEHSNAPCHISEDQFVSRCMYFLCPGRKPSSWKHTKSVFVASDWWSFSNCIVTTLVCNSHQMCELIEKHSVRFNRWFVPTPAWWTS